MRRRGTNGEDSDASLSRRLIETEIGLSDGGANEVGLVKKPSVSWGKVEAQTRTALVADPVSSLHGITSNGAMEGLSSVATGRMVLQRNQRMHGPVGTPDRDASWSVLAAHARSGKACMEGGGGSPVRPQDAETLLRASTFWLGGEAEDR